MSEEEYWLVRDNGFKDCLLEELAAVRGGEYEPDAPCSPYWSEIATWLCECDFCEYAADAPCVTPAICLRKEVAETLIDEWETAVINDYLKLSRRHGEKVMDRVFNRMVPYRVIGCTHAELLERLEAAGDEDLWP